MSNLSQFIGGVAGAKVGDIVEINSNQEIIIEGGKTYLKAGVEVLSSDYPNYPKNRINKLGFSSRNQPRIGYGSSGALGSLTGSTVETDGNGTWILVNSDTGNQGHFSIWRSEDDAKTWKCVYNYFFGNATYSSNILTKTYGGFGAPPIPSTNYIGTWVIRFNLSSYGGYVTSFLYSEDNGKTWQFANGLQSLRQAGYGSNIAIQPFGRALVISWTGEADGAINVPLGYYSPDFGRTWVALSLGNSNAAALDVAPVWAPDGGYYIPARARLDSVGGAPVVGFNKFNGSTLISAEAIIGVTTNLYGISIAFDSNGYMYAGAVNYAARSIQPYKWVTSAGNFEDITTELGFGGTNPFIQFKASINSPYVMATNVSSITAAASSMRISSDGGSTWSAEYYRPNRLPAPQFSGMGNNGKIIGFAYALDTKTRVSHVFTIDDLSTFETGNSYPQFPPINRMASINSSSFLAYSELYRTLYRGEYANGALTKIYQAGNTNLFAMASNETGANLVIGDLSSGQIRYSNNGLFTNSTMNLSWASSPAVNVYVDIRETKQNVAESGFSYSTRETTIRYLGFSSDGTKMYIAGTQKGNVDQYVLSTPWNPATATYDNKFLDLKSKEPSPYCGYFKPDGTQFYTAGNFGNVHQYTLSTAWDISTATYNVHCNVSSSAGSPFGIQFTPNGNFMYLNAAGVNRILQFKLNESWNIASIANSNNAFAVTRSPEGTHINSFILNGYSMQFSPDGRRLYFGGTSSAGADDKRIHEYGLARAWDIRSLPPSTVTNYRRSVLMHDTSNQHAFFIKPDGQRIFTSGATNDNVYSYEMNTSPTITPIQTTDNIADICYSNGVFLALSRDGYVLRSVDNGITWERRFITNIQYNQTYTNRFNGTDTGKRIKMSSNGTVIVVCEFDIYRSTDYGNTYTIIETGNGYKDCNKITTDNNGIWAFSAYNGGILYSTNDGVTWNNDTLNTPIKENLPGYPSLINGVESDREGVLSSNTITLDVEVVGSNAWAVLYGHLQTPNTYLFMTKNDGIDWELTVVDNFANASSVLVSSNNVLAISSNTVGQGGVQTVYDTIGLKTFTSKNQYIRVE